jgi:hypothetical protein
VIESFVQKKDTDKIQKRLFPLVYVLIISLVAGFLSYWGASLRPVLVPNPFFSALVVSVCVFLLLFPFSYIKRDFLKFLSPEVMAGIGYFIYIGFAGATNHIFPGLAVNPNLFPELPLGIIAQTIAALAFVIGAILGKNLGMNSPQRKTSRHRLLVVLFFYALVSLYISTFIQKADEVTIKELNLAGVEIPWVYTAGPFIVLQTIPMLLVSWHYLRGYQMTIPRFVLTGIFVYSSFLVFFSGSRTDAIQALLLLFIAYVLINKKFTKSLIFVAIISATVLLIVSTIWRVSGAIFGNTNITTISLLEVQENIITLPEQVNTIGIRSVQDNLEANFVYHLSDNQTMAMLIKQYYRGPLLGKASIYSLFSALPSNLRIFGFPNATSEIVNHFHFVKQPATDAPFWPDWQMTLGVLGFADFSVFGLIAYPFIAGLIIKWIYNRTMLTQGLGDLGWLLYLPIIQMLWSPQSLGPDSIQVWRFLIPLFVSLRWTARDK